jgi:hypothetical protein
MNLPKPFFAGAAGGGWRREVLFHCPARTLLTGIVLICRCPAGALLTANLRARAAAGGCFRACSSWHVLRRAGLGPLRPALSPAGEAFLHTKVCIQSAAGLQ